MTEPQPPLKPSGAACRYCNGKIQRIPLAPTSPPLVVCERCDRMDQWPNA